MFLKQSKLETFFNNKKENKIQFEEITNVKEASSPIIEEIINQNDNSLQNIENQISIIPRVFTPPWFIENKNNKNIENNKIDLEKILLKMTELHFEIEVIEARIQEGEDEIHEHPAMAQEVHLELGLQSMTKKERQHRNLYELKFEKNIVPLFWEKRVWDKDFYKLDEKESELLKEDILNSINGKKINRKGSLRSSSKNLKFEESSLTEEFESLVSSSDDSNSNSYSDDEINEIKSKLEENPKNIGEKMKTRRSIPQISSLSIKPICKFSSKIFNTDNSDCLTDWE